MRRLITLVLALGSSAASEENWVFVRNPPALGEYTGVAVLVDTSSIEILEIGIRRARSRADWSLGASQGSDTPDPSGLRIMTWSISYDCAKRLERLDAFDTVLFDGSTHHVDLTGKQRWGTTPENPAADPAFAFVCTWKQ